MSMTDFETKMLQQMSEISRHLLILTEILNVMVTEGLVTLPDVPASDN